MSGVDIRRLEDAALSAWPAREQIEQAGWVVRFANGYTKRANSATALALAVQPVGNTLTAIEEMYIARSLPPVFRLTPLAPAEIDAALAARGYTHLDETVVMTCDLAQRDAPQALSIATIDEWIDTFARLEGPAILEHRALIERIATPCLFAQVQSGECAIACGLGVLDDNLFGLFDIVTDAEQRGRGYGTALVAGMLAWAGQRGAKTAYLQVVATNAPARRLYERLGFRERYRYWYRVRAAAASG